MALTSDTARQTLRDEMQIDPLVRGYAGMADATAVLSSLTTSNRTRDRVVVPTHEVFGALLLSDVAALAQADRDVLQGLLSMGDVNVQDANTRTLISDMFPSGVTRTNLIALQTESITRLEELTLSIPSLHQIDNARA